MCLLRASVLDQFPARRYFIKYHYLGSWRQNSLKNTLLLQKALFSSFQMQAHYYRNTEGLRFKNASGVYLIQPSCSNSCISRQLLLIGWPFNVSKVGQPTNYLSSTANVQSPHRKKKYWCSGENSCASLCIHLLFHWNNFRFDFF